MSRPGQRIRRPRSNLRGIEALESRLLLSTTLIPVADHRDLVVDATRNELIIVSSTGIINRYDIAGGQLLASPINLNITAGGADISADGQYLYVTQQAPSTNLTLLRVNLNSGSTTSFTASIAPSTGGFYDCKVLADGRVELTTVSPGNGQIYVEFNPTTLQFSQDPAFNNKSTRNANAILRSADRQSAIFLDPPGNTDAGGIQLLQLPDTDKQLLSNPTAFTSNATAITSTTTAAINATGTLVAVDQPAGIELFNTSGTLLSTLLGMHGGLAFSATGSNLFVADASTTALHIFNVSNPASPALLDDLDMDETLTGIAPSGNGQIATSPDGSEFFVTASDGIRVVNQILNDSPATLSLSAPASSVFLQTVTLTATVSSPNLSLGAAATGVISFYDNEYGFPLLMGTATLQGGTATFATSALDIASHPIAAVYSGDSNFTYAVSSQQLLTVNKITPTIAFDVDDSPNSTLYVNDTPTLRINPVFTDGVPFQGSLTLFDATTNQRLAILGIPNGTASYLLGPLEAGTYEYRADYSGNGVYSSASGLITITVIQAPTQITLSPLAPGDLTLTANIDTPDQNYGIDGTATILEDGQAVATSPVQNGVVQFDLSDLAPGPHLLTATFNGNDIYEPSTSASLQQTIPFAATVSLSADRSLGVLGQTLQLSATVTPAISGVVDFFDGGVDLGTASIAAGVATISFPAAQAGERTFTAQLDPDGSYLHVSATASAYFYQPTILDIVAMYSQQELQHAGSVPAILSAIQQQIQDVNTVFANSQIPVSVRLDALVPANYSESGNIDTDWNRLHTPGDGYLDNVFTLRTQFGADLVVLLDSAASPSGNNQELDGEASLLTASAQGSSLQDQVAFLVIDANAPETDYVLAHEIGHTLGAAHAIGDPGGPGVSSIAYGYRFTGNNSVLYHDVMAYAPGTAIPYYANPNVDYQGVPTGSATASNLAAVFATTAPEVAAYRTTRISGSITAADASAISGWVFDPQAMTAGSTIEISIDGVMQAPAPADQETAALLPLLGTTNHGFSYSLPPLLPGRHAINLYALDAVTGLPVLIATQNVSANTLAWKQAPATVTAGQTFAKPPVLLVKDAAGHLATDSHATLTLSVAGGPAGGTLTGVTSLPVTGGSVTFSGVSFSKAGTYMLSVSDGAITLPSIKFTVNSAPATQFSFDLQPPADVVAGTALAIRVAALDPFGNAATLDRSKISLTLTGTAGGVLNRPASASLGKGLAGFSGVSIARAGTYTLTAWHNGQAVATSASFTVDAAAPAKIIFAQLPAGAVAGAAAGTPIIADIVDRFGNIAATDNAAVTLSIASHPKNAPNPTGTLLQNATAGVVTFGDILFAAPGPYTLKATQGKFSGKSLAFTVSPAGAKPGFLSPFESADPLTA